LARSSAIVGEITRGFDPVAGVGDTS
jgi:hypothetical protein